MKYEFTGEKKEYHGVLHRIRAVRDFGNVKAGDLGGWIESISNLSQEGNAWVGGDAIVCGNAVVSDDACVYGTSRVYNDACVYGNSRVYDNARVYDTSRVYGNAVVSGTAEVFGRAVVEGDKVISEGRIIGK